MILDKLDIHGEFLKDVSSLGGIAKDKNVCHDICNDLNPIVFRSYKYFILLVTTVKKNGSNSNKFMFYILFSISKKYYIKFGIIAGRLNFYIGRHLNRDVISKYWKSYMNKTKKIS